jgi:hypothetical protein
MIWHKVDIWTGPRIIVWYHIVDIAEKIGGDIPIGGVILLPMILGGDIYQMHT